MKYSFVLTKKRSLQQFKDDIEGGQKAPPFVVVKIAEIFVRVS
jgi:hypothetical protein